MNTKKNLIIYWTVDWHALKISYFVKEKLKDNIIDIFNVSEFSENLENYEKILIVSSIRYWKFHKNIRDFVEKNFEILNSKKSAFISINLVARKPNKKTPETNVYTRKFFEKTPFKPKLIWVFGWVLDYEKYGFFDWLMIKFIMKITKGPTNTKDWAIEYTDWNQVEKFCESFGVL